MALLDLLDPRNAIPIDQDSYQNFSPAWQLADVDRLAGHKLPQLFYFAGDCPDPNR